MTSDATGEESIATALVGEEEGGVQGGGEYQDKLAVGGCQGLEHTKWQPSGAGQRQGQGSQEAGECEGVEATGSAHAWQKRDWSRAVVGGVGPGVPGQSRQERV